MKKSIITGIVIGLVILSIVYLEGTKSEQTAAERTEISIQEISQANTSGSDNASLRISEKQEQYQKAIELVSPNSYINTEPFNLSDHIGKNIILVDFWTYSCINCQRTLPYLAAWDRKYRDQGLLIVGVHTPEFAFEKDRGNVLRAVEKYGVEYPVVQDNERQTWSAYRNRYWPRKYLIDIDGFIVYDHIGEGAYGETETTIQELLQERSAVLGLGETPAVDIVGAIAPDLGRIRTPELYFGYEFARDNQMGNAEGWRPGSVVLYRLPAGQQENMFYLEGSWDNQPDYMQAASQARVLLQYTAKDVYMVAGAAAPVKIEVFVDGEPLQNVTVNDHDLYTMVQGSGYGTHQLELRVPKGARLYTFTFG